MRQRARALRTLVSPGPGEPFAVEGLPAGDFVDLGELRLEPPGRARFVSEPADALARDAQSSAILISTSNGLDMTIARTMGWFEDGLELLPGKYYVYVLAGDGECRRTRFEVISGETVVATLTW